MCEINNEAKYCALPGDFIVKENSFYVEVVPGHDEVSIIFRSFNILFSRSSFHIHENIYVLFIN